MDYKEIIYECKDAVVLVTLNRPDIRNAITGITLIEELVDALQRIQHDRSIKVMILTGAGTAFSAGGNIKEMQAKHGMFSGDPEEVRENYRRAIQRIPRAFSTLDVPTIAAVNGPAIGAGCDLAAMCDIRIASERARFGETFLSVGLIPGDGGSYFLQRLVGPSKACELVFTCRVIDAKEALRIGLVSEVTSAEDLLDRCWEVAREIARQPARALRMAKRLMLLSHGAPLSYVLELSAAYQAICHHCREHQESLEALLAQLEAKGKRP